MVVRLSKFAGGLEYHNKQQIKTEQRVPFNKLLQIVIKTYAADSGIASGLTVNLRLIFRRFIASRWLLLSKFISIQGTYVFYFCSLYEVSIVDYNFVLID